MLRSKIRFLFDDIFVIIVPLLLVLYTQNIFILLISLVFITYKTGIKEILIFLFVILLILLRLLIDLYHGTYFYVKEVKTGSIIASNILYDIKIYGHNDLTIDDIIKVEKLDDSDGEDKDDSILYTSDEVIKVSDSLTFRGHLFDLLMDKEDSFLKDFLGQTIFSYYDYDSSYFLDISYSLSTYFFLKAIIKLLKTNKHSFVIAMIIVVLLFGIDYRVIRVFIFEIYKLKIKDKKIALSFSIITLLIFDPFAIKSYRFIIPVLIRAIFQFKTIFNFKMVMMLVQSYFFGSLSLFQIIFYRFFMNFIVTFDTLGIIALFIRPLYQVLEAIFSKIDIIAPYLMISLRGKISFTMIILLYLLIRSFKIESQIMKLIMTFLFISSNISNLAPSVSFIDVGQGDAILIKTFANREVVLIDTGNIYNYYKLDRFLQEEGIYEIDRLIITHGDSDHSANIADVIKDYKVDKIVFDHVDVRLEEIYLRSLNKGVYNDANDDSLVYHLYFNGISFLFTGDISRYVERDIVSREPFIDVDVLKLSHHGSKTGSDDILFMNYDIDIAVASTSGQYGHPSDDTITTLDRWQVPYLTTKEDGDIVFRLYFDKFILKKNDGFVIIGQ